jgi:hypothetical protein
MESQIREIDAHLELHKDYLTTQKVTGICKAWTVFRPVLLFLENTILALKPQWKKAAGILIAAMDAECKK